MTSHQSRDEHGRRFAVRGGGRLAFSLRGARLTIAA
jgi:hypothetical protein